MAYVKFSEADTITDRFLTLLKRYGIDPPVGSNLESELLSLTELMSVIRDPNIVQGHPDEKRIIRTAAGIYDLAAKILAVDGIPEFDCLVPHLKLIMRSKLPKEVDPPSLIQNDKSHDDTSRKIAELYLGTLVAHVCKDLELDHPTRPRGDNPDLLFTLVDGDSAATWRFGIAVKAIGRKAAGQTIFERIQEAGHQIDLSPAERGLIVISAKNDIDHDTLWNTVFADEDAAIEALKAQLQTIIDRVEADRPQTEWDALFTSKCARPIVFMAHTAVKLATEKGGPVTPTALQMTLAYGANGALDPVANVLSNEINKWMHYIRRGISGAHRGFPL